MRPGEATTEVNSAAATEAAGFGIRADYRHGGGNATGEVRRGGYWTPLRRHTHRYFQAAVYRLAREVMFRERLRSVLDAGCGPGEKLRAHLAGRVDVLAGVDQPACARYWTGTGDGTRFQAVDLEADGVSLGRTFDLVMAVDVIEHLDDPDRLLTFLRAHMHERSRFLISTPEREILRGPANLRSPKAEHLREWTREEFRSYLESRGFVVEQQRIVDSYDLGLSPIMWLYRIRDAVAGHPRAHTQVVLGRTAPGLTGRA